MRNYIKLIRVKHWIKNSLVLVIPILNYRMLTTSIIMDLVLAFLALSMAASCVYVFNDILDLKDDRLHPTKKSRPLASGSISIKQAVPVAISFFIGALLLASRLGDYSFMVVSIYLLVNIAYTLDLKRRKFIDIFCLALFLMMRILVGAAVSNLPITNEFILFIVLMLLSLSLKKRYKELINRGVARDQKIRGYIGRDVNNIHILSKVTLFASIGFYNMHVMNLPGFDGLAFICISFCSLYMGFILSEDDGPEDIVDLVTKPRALLTLCLNVLLILYFLQ